MLTSFRALAMADAVGARCVRSLPHRRGVDRVLIGLSRLTDHSDGWLAVGLIAVVCDRDRSDAWLNGVRSVPQLRSGCFAWWRR